MSEVERRKDICRSYTHVLVKRGRLVKQPCWICGVKEVEAHHPDYSLPAFVIWVCREHHRTIHERLHAQSGVGVDRYSSDVADPGDDW